MVRFRDLLRALQDLGIERSRPVLVHASLSAFGQVNGGAETVVGALLGQYRSLLAPTFTFKTMLIPEAGPAENAIQYGSGATKNRMAEFYHADMPADRLMGIIPETIRRHRDSCRSGHPILSFSGVQADLLLALQDLDYPLGPVQGLYDQDGWVLLLGVDHTVNTSLHYAERLAGRKQFVRWALTGDGVVQCPGFPGCSDGFQAIRPYLELFTSSTRCGNALIQAVPVKDLVDTTVRLIERDPDFMLCSRTGCERCAAVRAMRRKKPGMIRRV